jgi:hypothetical protein
VCLIIVVFIARSPYQDAKMASNNRVRITLGYIRGHFRFRVNKRYKLLNVN